MKKVIVLLTTITLGIGLAFYFDLFHKPVECIDALVGKDYNYAYNQYFEIPPNNQYIINVNKSLNEFDGGILNKKKNLTDSIVYVYTWVYKNHKKTIWTGKTKRSNKEIIDAIRYKNSVQF